MAVKKKKLCSTGANVSARNQCDYLSDIRGGLDKENLTRFRESCFGPWLGMDCNQSQGQLLFLMYKHIDPESIHQRQISFIINERRLAFGPVEFFTITGLRFGKWEDPPESSSIHSDVFGGKQKLFVKDVYDAFAKESADSGGKGDKVLKLALLLMLYSYLLVRHRTGKRIEVQYLHLVDDLERFNQFPWGVVVYQFLVTASHNCKTIIDNSLAVDKKPTFDAYGFTFAIQVFAYEVHANVALHCAIRPRGCEHQFPRMLRWRANNFFRYNELLTYFAVSFAQSLKPMENTPGEIVLIEAYGINNNNTDLEIGQLLQQCKILLPKPKRLKRKLFSENCETSKNVKNIERINTNCPQRLQRSPRMNEESQKSVFIMSTDDDISKHATKMMSLILEKISSVEEKLNDKHLELMMGPRQCRCRSNQENKGYMPEISKESIQDSSIALQSIAYHEESVSNDRDLLICYNVFNCPNETSMDSLLPHLNNDFKMFDSCEENTDICPANIISVKKTSPSSVKCAPKTNSIGTRASSIKAFTETLNNPPKEDDDCTLKEAKEIKPITPFSTNEGRTFLPTKLYGQDKPFPLVIVPVDSINKFSRWYCVNRDSKSKVTIEVPYVGNIHASWFDKIWQRHGLLDSDHVDTLLNNLLRTVEHSPLLFDDKWTAIEQFGWETISSEHIEVSIQRIMSYVQGKFPRVRGKPWHSVEKVYGIGHVQPLHWVCYSLELKRQVIIVYDSLSTGNRSSLTQEAFKNVVKNVPLLLERSDMWSLIGEGATLKPTWDLWIDRDPPQQTNGSDCGILAMKYLQCLVSGHPPSILKPTDCNEDEFSNICYVFRKSFCVELLNADFK